MREAVYNSSIPDVASKSVKRGLRLARVFRIVLQFSFFLLSLRIGAFAVDWSAPEQNLARKIAAITGPGAIAVAIENRSSLNKRDSDIIQNGLRSALEALGIRFVNADQSAATVSISLSENAASYVWVAEIHQGAGESAVVMVSAPRPEGSLTARDSVPLVLRKTSLWSQGDPILDVAVLEESQSPTHIAVLEPEKLSLYRFQNGKWQAEQSLSIVHNRPWPRDIRGRIIPASDHLLDAYLPGVICSTAPSSVAALNCRESDDPWPLLSGTMSGGAMSVFPSAGLGSGATTLVPQMKAFFASTRNFFTGVLAPGVGKFTTVPKFYSAAFLPREKYTLWLFATTDGMTHMVDGVSDQAAKLGWGSDFVTVKTACGAGWQVLASSRETNGDFVRAYEFPDREPVAVSTPVDFQGTITAMWTEAHGDTAVVVTRDPDKGNYEAFRLAMACSQ
ncbi:MAG TPA: hypothetical protein VKV39_14505 [Candidatus Sulfotelmatobacter sp.]|nr:hypothetical protein [Candidatus Sulfotelmatobacter sp.]